MVKRGLLIGAGFSYDLGMPLAIGFTKDLFHFLQPERMNKYLDNWKMANPFGPNRPIDPQAMDEVFEIYKKFYSSNESNYESFLKEIQKQYHEQNAKQDLKDGLYYIFGKMFDMIFQMFWMYQVNNLWVYTENQQFYRSFAHLALNDELWVLSLNHDLVIEFLCFDNNIPISFGSIDSIAIPESNLNLNDSVSFSSIARNDMQLEKMSFIRDKCGVNLLKLHGAINEFSYDDDKYILHIAPQLNETPISYLTKTNKVLHEMKYFINESPMYVGSEIVVSDFEKQPQFLRKSILIGGYKYSKTFDPKPGEEKISLMEEVLLQVGELTIMGYGFGDEHINLRLYNAMLLNPDLAIFIVDPYRNKIPDCLMPFDYKMRVRLARCTASQWISYLEKGQWDTNQSEELAKLRRFREIWDEYFRKQFLSP